MTGFVVVRYHFDVQLMQSSLTERSEAVAQRVASSVRLTIWNIYQKSYDRKYTDEIAAGILDSEMQSDFVLGIKVFGNFGHLYMGRIKHQGNIQPYQMDTDEPLWKQQDNRIRYPIKVGLMTIGNVEVLYSDRQFADNLRHNLLVDILQVAIVSLLFVGALSMLLKISLVAPMQELQIAQQALDSLDEAVFVTDARGRIIDINPSYSQMTDYHQDQVLGQLPAVYSLEDNQPLLSAPSLEKILSQGNWSGEVIGQRSNGRQFPGWLTLNRVEGKDSSTTLVGVLNDIEEKKAAEDKLHHLAYFDSLTDIPNRRSFMLQLESDIRSAKIRNNNLGLLFIDLDNFKWTNDSFGHDVGDQLLVELAQRFQSQLEARDKLYRIGGDEFTVLVHDYDNPNELYDLARRLIDAAGQRLILSGSKMKAGTSIGIATYPTDADTAQELIKRADAAMFQAKELGRGQARFFSLDIEESRRYDQRILDQLKEAIGKNEFELYYQPKVDLSRPGFPTCGVEGLIRWHREGEVVCSPDVFIAIAERSNLICDIGYWVIDTACQQIAHWREAGLGNISLAINLSPRQFQDKQLYGYLKEQLAQHQVTAGQLEIEITERAVIEDIESSVSTLNQLRSLGIRIAMDDFGTGYSSLAYLKQLPIDVLKVDRSFINTLPRDRDDIAIVKAIFSMARALDITVVAEGVENAAQLEFLVSNHCHYGQGYYFSRPLPSEQFSHWYNTQQRQQQAVV